MITFTSLGNCFSYKYLNSPYPIFNWGYTMVPDLEPWIKYSRALLHYLHGVPSLEPSIMY